MNVVRVAFALAAATPNVASAVAPGADAPAPPPAKRFDTTLPPLFGVAVQTNHSADLVGRYAAALHEIAALGANCVLLSVDLYQPNAGSDMIRPDPQRTPSAQELRQLIALARALGLRVVLMPKVLLSAPRGNEWRGKIKPPNWDGWFDQYRRHIVNLARMADQAGVDVFIIGSELVSTEQFTGHWRRLIRDVRQVFDGRLAYSANWDHYENIEFWDDLDLIGLTTYYKLADEPGASVATLVSNWRPIREKILSWQRTIGRPIIFTEVGWCSQEGAAVEAWNYYRTREATPAGLLEQRNCYEAFIETWGGVPQVGGVIWWEWTIYPGGPDDINYTPRGKPAEQVLRRWFATQRRVAERSPEFAKDAPDKTASESGRRKTE